MKKLYLLAACFFSIMASQAVRAQSASSYYFSYKAGIRTDSMIGATTLLGAAVDDMSSNVVSLPFSIKFGGISYQHFSVSSNGLLGLGTTQVNAQYYDYALVQSATYPIITPFAEDFSTGDNGGVRYKIFGAAGSRKLLVEWRVKNYTEPSMNFTKVMQCWLYEGSNVIRFVYGNGTTDFDNAAIGIAGTKSDYLAVNSITNTASSTAGTLVNNNFPVAGTCYSFSPTSPSTQQIVVGTNGTIKSASCGGASDGAITLGTISGGDGEYCVKWTGPNGYTGTGTSISALAAGLYHYDIIDIAGSKPAAGDVQVSQASAGTATITASGATTFCQGGSVNLTASSAASYKWSTGETTQTITATTSGNYSVTTTDISGCQAVAPTVAVTVTAGLSATITMGSDKNFLCSGVALTASSPSSNNTYLWSNGATTASINLTSAHADTTYNVRVTDNSGCVGNASYTFKKQDLIGSYTVVAKTSIGLGSGSTVIKGSVGVTGATGTISLGSNSSVAATGAVVKAKSITVSSPVNAPVRILAPATLTLPVMQPNTVSAAGYTTYIASGTATLSSNYTTLTIKAGANITLTGSIFGTVTVESGATVTFTNTTVNIDKLVTSTSKASATAALATVKFAPGSAVKVSTSVFLYGRSRVNVENNDVTFYLGDNNTDAETFTISGLDTKFNGTIYIPVGTLAVTGTDVSTTTNLNGLFIADKITSSGAKVVWGSATCTTSTTTRVSNVAVNSLPEVYNQAMENKFKVYPSVTTGEFTVQLNKENVRTTVLVLDNQGRPVLQQLVEPNSSNSVRLNLSNKPAGIYIVKVISDKEEHTSKIILHR